jgi:hypothetical protein
MSDFLGVTESAPHRQALDAVRLCRIELAEHPRDDSGNA